MGTEEAVRPWPPQQSCSVCASWLQPGPGDLPALRSPAPWLPGDGITRSQIAAPSPWKSRGDPGCSARPPLGFQKDCRAGRGSPSWGWCWGSLVPWSVAWRQPYRVPVLGLGGHWPWGLCRATSTPGWQGHRRQSLGDASSGGGFPLLAQHQDAVGRRGWGGSELAAAAGCCPGATSYGWGHPCQLQGDR